MLFLNSEENQEISDCICACVYVYFCMYVHIHVHKHIYFCMYATMMINEKDTTECG